MSSLYKVRKCKRFIVNGILAALLCLFMVFSPGCPSGIRIITVYQPKELVEFFREINFTPLPFPDSKYKPGAIIRVTDDIKYVDDLTSCGYPLSEFQEEGYIPPIIFTKKVEFGASAIINIKGVTTGPNFERISKVRLEITDHGADAFRLIKLKVWMEDPDNIGKVSQVCMDELLKKDVYLITEAFRVSKAKYTLYDKTGAAIKIETPVLGNLLKFQPDVKYEVTSDGSLVIEQPVYLAVRKAVRIGEDFQTLKRPGGESETADAKIEKLFFKTAVKK